MQRDSRHTLEENMDILGKLDKVIETLREAGGICVRDNVKRDIFVFDVEKYGKRGFLRALKDCGSSGGPSQTY